MSEEKKKLGVEDLVQAQRETAEQLKIIAERLDWIAEAEPPKYQAGCVTVWILVMTVLTVIVSIKVFEMGHPLALSIGLLTFAVVLLTGHSMRYVGKSPAMQRHDKWADQQYRKRMSASHEQRANQS